MMEIKNILITGSNGFIGKNLKKRLQQRDDIKLFEFNRNDKMNELEKIIKNIDFIFHFAGEVRPNSSDEEFLSSHNLLTIELIKVIEKNNLSIPILFTSSKHACNPKNMYGQSKLETEEIIIHYGEKNNEEVFIYRLSHIFGEGCKPNYNSVISTWIYNTINDLPVKVFDRNIPMRYIYVQDVVNKFLESMDKYDLGKIYYDIDTFYDTTLGSVLDYLEEFRENEANSDYILSDDDQFKKKLYTVYLDYLKNNRN